jgi:EAL and modified HD-GYP domain-containing signal transduction protein
MDTTASLEICVGRQPIYDRYRKVVAYELLFRRPGATQAIVENPDAATAQVILNAVLEVGLERISGGHPVFLNCTRHFLENEAFPAPDRFVLEVLEDLAIDEGLRHAIRCRKQQGYRIALDDFVYRDQLADLVRLADYVKVDVMAQNRCAVEDQVRRLKQFQLTLLAEKVETEEELTWCQGLGFELFQGYFLRKPQALSGRRAPLSKLSVLCLMGQLMDPDTSLDKVARVISGDVALSYRLLQLANSAVMARRTPVDSIIRAVTTVGTDLMLRWATLLLMSGIDDCPPAYLELAIQRARICELLAGEHHLGRTDHAYLVGLLSLLDSMLSLPLEEVIPDLPLSPEIGQALLRREGDLGRILCAVLSYESGEISKDTAGLQNAYWQGVDYANQMTKAISVAK